MLDLFSPERPYFPSKRAYGKSARQAPEAETDIEREHGQKSLLFVSASNLQQGALSSAAKINCLHARLMKPGKPSLASFSLVLRADYPPPFLAFWTKEITSSCRFATFFPDVAHYTAPSRLELLKLVEILLQLSQSHYAKRSDRLPNHLISEKSHHLWRI